MKVYKIEAFFIDFDDLGEDGVRNLLEHTRYSNHIIGPKIGRIETREIDWSDDHLLNHGQGLNEFRRLFEGPLSARTRPRETVPDVVGTRTGWMRVAERAEKHARAEARFGAVRRINNTLRALGVPITIIATCPPRVRVDLLFHPEARAEIVAGTLRSYPAEADNDGGR